MGQINKPDTVVVVHKGPRKNSKIKTKQFWSVPFVDAKKRAKYLRVVKDDIRKDLGI